MMRHFPILFVFITLLVSCNKDRHVKIITEDALTGERFPNQAYIVTSIRTKDKFGYKIEKEGKTDADGESKFRINLRPGRTYSVSIAKSGSAFCKKYSMQIGSQDQVDGTITFQLVKGAHFRYGTYNTNCMGSTDLFKLYYGGNELEPLATEQLIRTQNGCASYPASFFEEIPMGKRFYRWEVTKNGITHIFYDSVLVEAADYMTYDIHY